MAFSFRPWALLLYFRALRPIFLLWCPRGGLLSPPRALLLHFRGAAPSISSLVPPRRHSYTPTGAAAPFPGHGAQYFFSGALAASVDTLAADFFQRRPQIPQHRPKALNPSKKRQLCFPLSHSRRFYIVATFTQSPFSRKGIIRLYSTFFKTVSQSSFKRAVSSWPMCILARPFLQPAATWAGSAPGQMYMLS